MLTVPENYGIVPVAEKIPATEKTGWSGRWSKNLKNRRRLYGLRRFFYAMCLKFPQVSLTLETQAKVSGKRARISWNRTT